MAGEGVAPETKIGFVPVSLTASIAFPEPRLLRKGRGLPRSRRAVQACPAVNAFERRTIEILAPYSLQLRCVPIGDGKFDFHLIEKGTRIDTDKAKQHVVPIPRDRWRTPDAPVVQIAIPYFFVCDTPCQLTMMPAWASPGAAQIPGQFISGRYPVHLWPRTLNIAFEWRDFGRDFKMKRGEPACYLYAEPDDPESAVSLVAARLTSDVAAYRARLEGVVGYTSQTFKLLDDIRKYRPETLLEEM